MTFSQYAGFSIVPTLARLVLAAVFIPAGWNKVFKEADFTADQATRLRNMGINVEPAAPKVVAFDSVGGRFVLASFRQDAPPADSSGAGSLRDPQTPPGDQPQTNPTAPATPPDAPPSVAPPVTPSDSGATSPPPSSSEPLPEGTYRAQGLHHVTLMLAEHRFPQPIWQARIAAFTELIGGSMLLLGLFSRVWGLGLAIAMGVAFYLVSMKMNLIFQTHPLVFSEDPFKASTAGIQLSLFVLAFGVFLTGAGPLSIDRMLFGGGPEDPVDGKID
jgi:uncharacterized membrane protein YphA (DoxX/SURF4 family)